MIYFLKVHAHVEIPQYLLRLNHCIVKGNCIYCFNFILYGYLDKLKRVTINVTVLGSTPTRGNELLKNEDVLTLNSVDDLKNKSIRSCTYQMTNDVTTV